MKKQKNDAIYNEELARQADLNKFNSITQSVKTKKSKPGAQCKKRRNWSS